MSPVVQIGAAALTIGFLAFLAFAALTEARRGPAEEGAPRSARRRRHVEERPREQRGPDARAGGPAFRRDALAAAEDPLLTPSNEEDRR